MVKAKTGISILKRVGFVLIAMPEPFTTPLGVACVLASSYLSKIREADINKHLKESLTRYLSHSKSANDATDNKSHARQKVKRYVRSEDSSTSWQDTGLVPIENGRIVSVLQNYRNNKENTVHHDIDDESIARHYPVTDFSKAKTEKPYSDVASIETDKPVHHSVDTESLSRRYTVQDSPKIKVGVSKSSVASEGTDKPVHHSVDSEALSRRFKVKENLKVKDTGSKSGISNEETDKPIHHSVDSEALSRRYKVTENPKVKAGDSKEKGESEETDKLIHHSVNMNALDNRFKTHNDSKVATNDADKSNPEKKPAHQLRHISLSRSYNDTDNSKKVHDKAGVSDKTDTVEHIRIKKTIADSTHTPDVEETTEHHSIDREFLSRRYLMV